VRPIGEPRCEILVGGVPLPCDAPVRTWHATGCLFPTRFHRITTRWIVNHWTASENAALRVYASMRGHRNKEGNPEPLSVHFIIDQIGEIYQCADADARCAHAADGGGNEYGVGIEIVNRGHGHAPARGYERSLRTERIHRREVIYGEFYPAQVTAVIALNVALARAYGLPVQVPLTEYGDVYPTTLPAPMRNSFRGSIGHLHLGGKVDPGLELLRRIHATGEALGLGVG
jgi:N-acetyl-anhydromuramyl-L-alanine amidase AmpD